MVNIKMMASGCRAGSNMAQDRRFFYFPTYKGIDDFNRDYDLIID